MATDNTEKKNKIELDWTMDPIERIAQETKALKKTDFMGIAIGGYLAAEMAKDENLANAYKDRKVTLSSIVDFIMTEANKKLGNRNGCIPDEEVYGWAIHFVVDGKLPKNESAKLTLDLTKEDKEAAKEAALKKYEDEQLKKLRAAEAKKKEREKKKAEEAKKQKESNQISLFDFIGDGGEA